MADFNPLKWQGVYSIPDLLERGIVLLDKPPKLSSHEVSAFARKILEQKRSGHSGTLDPDVSGVLLVALNRATRFLEYLNSLDKEYVCLARVKKKVPEQELIAAIKSFEGVVEQMPPKEAAVARRLRKRKVYCLEVHEVIPNPSTTDALFTSSVEKGTYIRVLCEDIGKALGVPGKMLELRRTKVGVYSESLTVTLQELWRSYLFWKDTGNEYPLRKYVHPLEEFNPYPVLVAKDSALVHVANGAPLYANGVISSAEFSKGSLVSIFDHNNRLVAVCRAAVGSGDIGSAGSRPVLKPLKVFAGWLARS